MSVRQGWPVSNGYAPAGGPRALPITLDFTTVTSIALDLLQEIEAGVINIVQSVYVDNSANPNALTLIWDQTNQRVVIPANAGGIWPVITPKDAPRLIASTLATGVIVGIILLNVPMPLTQWGPVSLAVANVNPATVAFTARSGNMTVGGTSQQLMAANAGRKYLFIENPSTEVESLFLNFGAAASLNAGVSPDSIELMPGGMWPNATSNTINTQQVQVNAATAGHKYIAFEG